MKIFSKKYLNDYLKYLTERYQMDEDDLDKIIEIKEVIDKYGEKINGYNDSSDDFFEVVEDATDWKGKYEDLKDKYRERFFEVSDKRYDDEDKESENIEDYEDISIEDVLYNENKEEK